MGILKETFDRYKTIKRLKSKIKHNNSMASVHLRFVANNREGLNSTVRTNGRNCVCRYTQNATTLKEELEKFKNQNPSPILQFLHIS